MKNIANYSLLLTFLVFSIISCTDNSLELASDSEIGIETHKHNFIQGETTINGQTIFYRSMAKTLNSFGIKIMINGQMLEAVVAYDQESLEIDGHGSMFTETQKDALLSLANGLFLYVDQQEGEVTYTEYSLIRLMEYWARAPHGYVYGKRSIGNADVLIGQRLGNEGISCIKKGTYVNAEYDKGRTGTRYSDRVKVGSKARSGYGCMGRCGADCGWGAPSAWTKDCMDHDQCSNVFNASGGSGDSNCGDEFNEAADDWLFGVVRGCRG